MMKGDILVMSEEERSRVPSAADGTRRADHGEELGVVLSSIHIRLSNQLVYAFSKCLDIVVYIIRCGFG